MLSTDKFNVSSFVASMRLTLDLKTCNYHSFNIYFPEELPMKNGFKICFIFSKPCVRAFTAKLYSEEAVVNILTLLNNSKMTNCFIRLSWP